MDVHADYSSNDLDFELTHGPRDGGVRRAFSTVVSKPIKMLASLLAF